MPRFHFALVAVLAAGLVPTAGARADSWTDGQAAWARHGFRHGAWDCGGDCRSGRHRSRAGASASPHRASFDGTWSVSAAGPCSGAGTSQLMISGSRIMGQNGSSGHVTRGGGVSTVGVVAGVTVVGEGRISGRFASGTYRQSDGCWSSWNAVKL